MVDHKSEALFTRADLLEAPGITPNSVEQAEILETRRHSLVPEITSPRHAMEYIKNMGEAALQPSGSRVLAAASAGERRAWLTGGRPFSDEPYVLNWSGPLDSDWDWVGLEFWIAGVPYVSSYLVDTGWQWAKRGNSYVTGYTPNYLQRYAYPHGFSSVAATYCIWDASRRMYEAV